MKQVSWPVAGRVQAARESEAVVAEAEAAEAAAVAEAVVDKGEAEALVDLEASILLKSGLRFLLSRSQNRIKALPATKPNLRF